MFFRSVPLLIVAALLLAGGVAIWVASQPSQEKPAEAPAVEAAAPTQEPNARGGEAGDAPAEAAVAAQPDATRPDAATPNATQPNASKPAAADSGPDDQSQGPWTEWLAQPAQPHAAFRFETLASRNRLLSPEDLQQWLLPAAPDARIGSSGTRLGTTAMFSGLMRLAAPWPDDAVLRMSLDQCQGLKIYAFHQDRGVLLVYRQQQQGRWEAYLTQRRPQVAAPVGLPRLASDDGQRTARTQWRQGGPLELHWRDGYLRLVRGSLTLLAAPLPGPPQEVLFEGQAAVLALQMRRCLDSPELPSRISSEPAPLGQLRWNRQFLGRGAELTEHADGAIELHVPDGCPGGWAFATLPLGLHHVLLQVEESSPGVGIYLAGDDGSPRHVLHYNASPEGQLVLRSNPQAETAGDDGGVDQEASADGQQLPPGTALVGAGPHWLRLLAGPRNFQWWIGQDGLQWARPEPPLLDANAAGRVLGVRHLPNIACRLKIRRLQLGTLSQLTAVGESLPPLHQRAVDPSANEAQLLPPAESPQQLAAEGWRRLRQHDNAARPEDLLALLEAGKERSTAQRQAAMLEASRLTPWAGDALRQVLQVMEAAASPSPAAGPSAAAEPSTVRRPYSQFQRRLWQWGTPLELPEHHAGRGRLIRQELLWLMTQQDWEATAELTRELAFYHQQDDCRLTLFAAAMAAREVDPAGLAAATPAPWLPVVVEEVDKTAFNAAGELDGLLQSESLGDVAQLVAATAARGGLTQNPRDSRHFLPFGALVALRAAEHSPLATALRADVEPVAELHIKRAMAEQDAAEVKRQVHRFPGTEAASSGWQWLGDRALSEGDAAAADNFFQRALAQSTDPAALSWRRQLAAAMLGEPAAAEPRGAEPDDLPIGDKNVSLEQRIQMLEAYRSSSQASAAGQPPLAGRPWRAELTGLFDGPQGRDPQQAVLRRIAELEIDWYGRQLWAGPAGSRLLVSNRFQLAAYQLSDGRRLWQTSAPDDNRLSAQRAGDFPLTPMAPLAVGDRLIARQLYGSGGLLRCFDAASGELQWELPGEPEDAWASDPQLLGGRIAAVRARQVPNLNDVQLRLVLLRAADGEHLTELPLLRVRSSWLARRHCQVCAVSDGLLMWLGGAALCVDPQLGVRWLRISLSLPVEEDQRAVLQHVQPPLLLDDGTAVFFQAGSPMVQCLSIDNGAIRWQRLAPALQELLTDGESRLLAANDNSLQCWDARDGETLWTAARPAGLACLHGGPLRGAFAMLRTVAPAQGAPAAVWLELRSWESGRLLVQQALDRLPDGAADAGPLVASAEAMWTLWPPSKAPAGPRRLVRIGCGPDSERVTMPRSRR